jgi:hypothetical protein
MTTPLPSLQQQFQDYLLGAGEAIAATINDSPKETAAALLEVYRDAYVLRLVEILGKDYPKTVQMLGEEPFDAVGRAYLRAYPSSTFTVRWFGRHLPTFLAGTAPWSDYPMLAEMAALEWALGEAFDAPDVPVIGPEAMAAVPHAGWPGLTFRLHPSLRRHEFRFAVPELWQQLEHGEAPAEPVPAYDAPVTFLIWREGLETVYRGIDPDEVWAVEQVLQGTPFGPLCDGLTEFHDAATAAGRAAQMLKQWLSDGLVVSYALSPEMST